MIVRELLTVFGVKYDPKGAQQAEESISGLIKGARVLVGAVAASAVVVGLKNLVDHQVEFARQLERTSKRLGIQTDSLQELRYAAEQAGIEQHTLDIGMQKFMIRTAQAAQGTGSAVKTLGELGVQLKDSAGNLRKPGDLIAQAADGFARLSSQADRACIAQTLFEEEGVQLIDMLQNGSAGLNKMRQQAEELGVVMDEQSLSAYHRFWQTLNRIGHALESLKRSFVVNLMPALQIAANGFEYFMVGLNKILKHTTLLKTILIVLAGVVGGLAANMVIAFAPVIATFSGIATAVGAVVLALDDLYAWFTGADSVTGRFFDKIKTGLQSMVPQLEADHYPDTARTLEGWVGRPTVKQTTHQNLKVDVHVKSGSNPREIGHHVQHAVRQELDRVHRNAYMALVPQ